VYCVLAHAQDIILNTQYNIEYRVSSWISWIEALQLVLRITHFAIPNKLGLLVVEGSYYVLCVGNEGLNSVEHIDGQ